MFFYETSCSISRESEAWETLNEIISHMSVNINDFNQAQERFCTCGHKRGRHSYGSACSSCNCSKFDPILKDCSSRLPIVLAKTEGNPVVKKFEDKCLGCKHTRGSHDIENEKCYVDKCGCNKFMEPMVLDDIIAPSMCVCGHESRRHTVAGACLEDACNCMNLRKVKKNVKFCQCGHEEYEHWEGEHGCTMKGCYCRVFQCVYDSFGATIGKSTPIDFCKCKHKKTQHNATKGNCIFGNCSCLQYERSEMVNTARGYAAQILRIGACYGSRYVYGIHTNQHIRRSMYIVGDDEFVRIKGYSDRSVHFNTTVDWSFMDPIDNLMAAVLDKVAKVENLIEDINQLSVAIEKKIK